MKGSVPLEQWRKNQIAVTISGAFVFFGFTLVMPFLPIFVRQLGVESTAGVALWSGLILGVSPLMSAFAGPIWGRIGDRIGLRLMAERATFFNFLCWFLMGFSQSVWHLFILRGILGLLGGFNSVSAALITQLSPRDKIPRLIGTLQSTQILSAAAGPFAGGILADTIGIRNTFFVTSVVMLGAFISIFTLYKDSPAQARVGRIKEKTEQARSFITHPEYVAVLLILFFVNTADRTFGPIIPLFLEQLGTPTIRLAAVSGTLISAAALAESFSAWLSGRLASRISLRSLILGRLVLSILILIPMVFVRSSPSFFALRVALALLAGGTLTLAFTAGSHIIPGEHRGAGFGILSSTTMFGGAAGPLIAGALAGFSIRSIFVFNALVYLLMIFFVRRNVQ